MATQYDTTYDSNDYFFVSGIDNSTFTAGRNSFRVNPSGRVKGPVGVSVYDPKGSRLNTFNLVPAGSTGYTYSEGSAQVFGVLVYPTTPAGVGRIEISSKAYGAEVTGAAGLGNDERWADGQVGNVGNPATADVVWVKAIFFDPLSPNTSDAHFFDWPELTATSERYPINTINGYNSASVSGICSADAVTPKHGDNGDYNFNLIEPRYMVITSNPIFNSAMVGGEIHLTNIIAQNKSLNVDFRSKISRVLTSTSLLLDRPLVVSKPIIDGGIGTDSEIVEETGVDVKRYDVVNETDFYSATAKASGIQQLQSQQVYNVGFSGVGHRKNYTVQSISSANFEITYFPRTTLSTITGVSVSLARLELTNLRTLTGAPDRYRVLKRSLNLPESPYCIAEGRLEPNELIFDWNAGADYSWVGRFYDLSFSTTYWITAGAASYTHSPQTLIDSISIAGSNPNSNEADYVVLKSVSDTSIKLIKNTMYSFELDYTNLISSDPEYAFDVYFLTTQNGLSDKVKIGTLNGKTTRLTNTGHYTNKFFASRTMRGTIQLVPKYITSVSVANLSLKPFRDDAYPLDSTTLMIPLPNRVGNERIELTVELFNNAGDIVYGTDSRSFGYNKSLTPLRDVVIADPQ